VAKKGQHCYLHRGLFRSAPPAARRPALRPVPVRFSAPPPPRRTQQERLRRQEEQRRERVRVAAEFCADALGSSWQEAAADRATGYVSDATWERLFLGGRRRRYCRALAKSVAALLQGKQQIHGFVGWMASRVVSSMGAGDVVQAFTDELVANIPLPWDAKVVAAARGIQVTGVLLCVVNGDELTRCQCFIDLALAEAKTRVRKLLVAAMDDWIGLGGFRPPPPR
jgi:hypothetical protein